MSCESLTLDGLELHDPTGVYVQAIEINPPPKRPQWISNPDADGDALISEARYERRTVTAQMRVDQQATMDGAIDLIAALEDKVQLVERTKEGVDLIWTPVNSTYSYTLKCLLAEITGLPMERSGDMAGWLLRSPVFTLRMDCKPFGYGDEVTSSTTTNANSLQELVLESVPGDVDAECEVVVTDNATQTRMHVEVGRETNAYNATTPQDLIIDKADMTATGYAGSSQTRDSVAVWRATLVTNPVTICATNESTENQRNHVGSYMVKLRGYHDQATTGSTCQVRLRWRSGADAAYTENAWATVLADNWSEVSLGLIDIEQVPSGQLQTWHGQIQAKAGVNGDTFDVREILLIPATQYGIGRGIVQSLGATPIAYDDFNQAAGNLGDVAADLGGNWDSAGDTAQIQVHQNDYAYRTATDDANLYTGNIQVLDGSSTLTDVEVSSDVEIATWNCGWTDVVYSGVIARYTDATHYVGAVLYYTVGFWGNDEYYLALIKQNGSAAPTIWTTALSGPLSYRVKLSVIGSTMSAYAAPWGTTDFGDALVSVTDSDLAGATFNDGKIGLYDVGVLYSSGTRTSSFDNFMALAALQNSFPAIYSGQSAEFRSDSAERENSGGTGWGDIPSYRGANFFIPPAGVTARKTRVVAKARRNDVNDLRDAVQADLTTNDSTSLQVRYTPRYLVIPRS